MEAGALFMLCGPSGVGKTSLAAKLAETRPDCRLSISHTTRPPAASELDESLYHFVSKERFEQMRGDGLFLESASIFGHSYGTSRDWVEKQLVEGREVILEIDWQGVTSVRALALECIAIAILPATLQDLETRLKERGRDNLKTVRKRMSQAAAQSAEMMEGADYIVFNKRFETTLRELHTIFDAQKLAGQTQRRRHLAYQKSMREAARAPTR